MRDPQEIREALAALEDFNTMISGGPALRESARILKWVLGEDDMAFPYPHQLATYRQRQPGGTNL